MTIVMSRGRAHYPNTQIGEGDELYDAHDSITSFGDPFLVTSIGWHSGDLHWIAGVGVNRTIRT